MKFEVRNSFYAIPAACAAAALILRIVALIYLQHSPLYLPLEGSRHDRAIYAAAAEAAAHGNFLPAGSLEYLPLYPWVLGVIGMMAGTGPVVTAAFGIVCDVLTTFLIVVFARRLGAGCIIAGVVGLLYAAYPLAAIYSLIGMPNTLNTLGVTAFAFLAHSVMKGSVTSEGPPLARPALYLALGILAGIVTLGFAGMILIALTVAAIAALRTRAWLPPLLIIAGLALPIAPVAIHNSRAEGSFTLLTTHGGLNFYMGNHEHATGYPLKIRDFRMTAGEMLEDAHAFAERESARTMTRAESSAWWKDQANTFWKNHPGDALALTLKKAALFWNHREMDDLRILDQLAVTTPFFANIIGTPFAVFGILGLIGLCGARHATVPRATLLAGMVGIVMFFITARYRLTFVPLMATLGAAGCTSVTDDLKARKWKTLIFPVLAAIVVMLPFAVRDQRPVDYYNAATQLISNRDLDRAMDLVEQGLAIDPAFGPLHMSRGNILFARDEFEAAAESFRTARTLMPGNQTVHFNLALSLARAGDYCGARDALKEQPLEGHAADLFRELNAACDE